MSERKGKSEKPERPATRYRWARAEDAKTLAKIEQKYRKYENEIIPFAIATPWVTVAENVIPDKDGAWAHPICAYHSKHSTTIGASSLVRKIKTWLDEQEGTFDILSITAGMDGDNLCAVAVIRVYTDYPVYNKLYEYLGEEKKEKEKEEVKKLIIPRKAYLTYTKEERETHEQRRTEQEHLYEANDDIPFLNRVDRYEKKYLPDFDDSCELVYNLKTKDMQISTVLSYKDFINVFQQCMKYVTGVEKDTYFAVIRGQKKEEEFWNVVDAYINKHFISTKILPKEDKPALYKKMRRALFQLYIVQDLVDDPDITDVKITDPFSIRVRIEGKAYLSNIRFIDADDYVRFINSIAVKNNIDLKVPSQTFTDEHDEHYILRFSITAPYITMTGLPIIHIRKVARKKLMSEDLIRMGMFNESIRDYLIDRGRDKDSMGVVFAGPPGSGKTVMLNWFLEDAYEQSAEILVIQENDELFAYRKGVMFEHVVNNPQKGERPCSLEDLGQMALVAGANVFIIGEAKGSEICSAITLSNSGCRTAITIHSPSSQQTIDKMADLAMRGYANSYDQAMRMITSFHTIVYLQDFKVTEISEVTGFDADKGRPIYRKVYDRFYGMEKDAEAHVPEFAEKQNKT